MKTKLIVLLSIMLVLSGCSSYVATNPQQLYTQLAPRVGQRLNTAQEEICFGELLTEDTITCFATVQDPYLIGTWFVPAQQAYFTIYRDDEGFLKLKFDDGLVGTMVFVGQHHYALVFDNETMLILLDVGQETGTLTISDKEFSLVRIEFQ